MSKVVSKTNPSRYYISANTPEYAEADWLINPPGLDSLLDKGVAARYWKIKSDDVVEMTAGEKSAVEAGVAAEAKDSIKDQADGDPTIKALIQAIATSTGKSVASVKTAFLGAVDGG